MQFGCWRAWSTSVFIQNTRNVTLSFYNLSNFLQWIRDFVFIDDLLHSQTIPQFIFEPFVFVWWRNTRYGGSLQENVSNLPLFCLNGLPWFYHCRRRRRQNVRLESNTGLTPKRQEEGELFYWRLISETKPWWKCWIDLKEIPVSLWPLWSSFL